MLRKRTHADWMVSEDRFLRQNYGTDMSREEICASIPRHSWGAIRCHATKGLGLTRPPRKGEYRPTPTWDRMKAMLQVEKLTVSELVERLDVTQQRIAELIGLHRDEIYVCDREPSPQSGGQRKPVYAYGNGSDAPKPVTVRQAKKAKSRNPFLAAAGMVKAPSGQTGRIYHHLWDEPEMEAA